MRLIMYRVIINDASTVVSLVSSLPGVNSIEPKTRGQLVYCDDAITSDQLSAIDAILKIAVKLFVDGPGPGKASGIPAEDDRTNYLH
jgi:hypothetical protein